MAACQREANHRMIIGINMQGTQSSPPYGRHRRPDAPFVLSQDWRPLASIPAHQTYCISQVFFQIGHSSTLGITTAEYPCVTHEEDAPNVKKCRHRHAQPNPIPVVVVVETEVGIYDVAGVQMILAHE